MIRFVVFVLFTPDASSLSANPTIQLRVPFDKESHLRIRGWL